MLLKNNTKRLISINCPAKDAKTKPQVFKLMPAGEPVEISAIAAGLTFTKKLIEDGDLVKVEVAKS